MEWHGMEWSGGRECGEEGWNRMKWSGRDGRSIVE